MIAYEETNRVGEVHCLNCGRVLAQVLRDEATRKLRLAPAVHQPDVQVVIAGRRLLRCGRCGGRAFIEFLEEPGEERAAAARPVAVGVG